MADIKKLAPILLKWEAGVLPYDIIKGAPGFPEAQKPISLELQWKRATKKGFSNHPNDTGGATMCGVTIAAYKRYRKLKGRSEPTVTDLKNITLDEWLDILRVFYWDKMKADGIKNQSIANLCVDNVWGSGAAYIKQIQLVAGTKPDGIVGAKTLAAINGANQRQLFTKLWNKRQLFYNNLVLARPANKVFLKGWNNRLKDFKFSE